jgi:hypothetical protein
MAEPSSENPREDGRVRIAPATVSLRMLASWGAIIFAAGFCHGRYLSNIDSRAAAEPASANIAQSASPLPTPAASLTPQPAARGAQVTIHLLKLPRNESTLMLEMKLNGRTKTSPRTPSLRNPAPALANWIPAPLKRVPHGATGSRLPARFLIFVALIQR